MAAQTGRLLQDPSLGIHLDGATISAKANFTGQRKVGAGGRKSLEDLSNTEKLSTQGGGRKALDVLKNLESKRTAPKASEKLPTGNRKALSTQGGDRKALDVLKNLERKRAAPKASEKLPTGNRKALSTQGGGRKALDVLKNLESERATPKTSEKLPTGNRKALSDISNIGKIKNKSSQKSSALTEEHFQAIEPHNHQAFIKSKSQSEYMSLCDFGFERHAAQCTGLDLIEVNSSERSFC